MKHEYARNWSAAHGFSELALQQDPSILNCQKGFLNRIKQADHHETYLSQISGAHRVTAYSRIITKLVSQIKLNHSRSQVSNEETWRKISLQIMSSDC